MKRLGSKLREFIWDLLFPIKCLDCGQGEEWLCADCRERILIYNESVCPICDVNSYGGAICGFCRHDSYLDGLFVVVRNSKTIKQIIYLLKYNFVVSLSSELKILLQKYFAVNPGWRDFYVLVPVPLYRRRYLWRGFNQAEIIADLIGELQGNRIEKNLLRRVKYHQPQVGLDKADRQKNILDNFKLGQASMEKHKTIILIDDVYTTGSTMQECAKVLKRAGYKKVYGLVLIRG